MRITITDAKHTLDETESKMVVEGLQSLLDFLYPALMNDLDRRGCGDFLYNYLPPSTVHEMKLNLTSDQLASVLMTEVVRNDHFAMSDEDEEHFHLLDVLEALDIDNHLFYVEATIQDREDISQQAA